ncbi:tRNA (adenosine(37)-N6)-threonylcarbamoyltransferase complex dimerization subunit type 1 TsaB [Candidatus Uhrbacteria bacterium]|nr:tRNA (adenosine(37)-N6)-threonylcarbamoyltransferase complex dimerization subunit type 1 TsaB [Candidatus Uhrbacteria bacterium]
MSPILYIDSSDRDRIIVKLVEQGSTIATLGRASRNGHSVTIIPAIQILLRRAKRILQSISGVAVVGGPGPFTAVRVGVVVANALAWSLGVPVHGISQNDFLLSSEERVGVRWHDSRQRKFRPVMPVYGAEPNITIART